MEKVKAGWIGFKEQGDLFWENAKTLAELGYCGMEGGEALLTADETDENIKRFHGLGLRVLTISADRNGLTEEGLAKLIARAHQMDTDRVTIWCGGVNSSFWDKVPVYDDFMEELETYENAAGILAREGIRLTYHNHFQEFTEEFKGVQAYNYMLTNTDRLYFELDVAWATYGGINPVDVMRRLGERLIALHVKDYVMPPRIENPNHPNIIFTGLGTGLVDLTSVLQYAAELKLPYVVVEQDQLRNLSIIETLRLGYYFMKETGFVV